MHYRRAPRWHPARWLTTFRGSHVSRALQTGAGGQTKSFQQKSLHSDHLVTHILERAYTRRKAQVTLAAEKPGTPEHDEEGGVGIHTVLAEE